MTTILELDITEKEERLLREMLLAMNISFRSQVVEENPYSDKEMGKAIRNCLGLWKDRNDFQDFNDFRKQAWGGRGV